MSHTLLAFPIGVAERVVSMRRWIACASVALLLMSGGAIENEVTGYGDLLRDNRVWETCGA